MLVRRQQGLTLLELIIGISIMAFLMAMGMPHFTRWLQDAQNRAAAESVMNGLQLARMESLRRNTPVRFKLTDSSGRVAWEVGCVAATTTCPATIQSRQSGEDGGNARVGVERVIGAYGTAIVAGSNLVASVAFDGLGRAPLAGSAEINRIDITNARLAQARRYVVTIASGGQIRMCDPALTFPANPQGCG
ncbi:MAG: prepilin-type N-terminal cleavage/methylation protein [Pseudoduganella sp.]|jgi:type IV fimbrial biogenesis protein FimT|nr:prepilin-type N-terminal cleavage/methylation protein [Pseudoduganella sp.]